MKNRMLMTVSKGADSQGQRTGEKDAKGQPTRVCAQQYQCIPRGVVGRVEHLSI